MAKNEVGSNGVNENIFLNQTNPQKIKARIELKKEIKGNFNLIQQKNKLEDLSKNHIEKSITIDKKKLLPKVKNFLDVIGAVNKEGNFINNFKYKINDDIDFFISNIKKEQILLIRIKNVKIYIPLNPTSKFNIYGSEGNKFNEMSDKDLLDNISIIFK